MALTPTTAFTKIARLKKPIRLIRGGTRSSKTWSILQYLILFCHNKELTVSIIGKTYGSLEKGCIEEFKKILIAMGDYNEDNYNQTKHIYYFNNSKFQFITGEEPFKLRGITSDIAYFTECNGIPFESFNEINQRCKLFCFCDWNPSNVFWADTYLVGKPNVDFITLTYKDNEFLEQKIIDEIESWKEYGKTNKYYANKWRVMGLGELGIQEGQIITDYDIIEELPVDAKLLGSGLDFGFASDVNALISVYKYNDDIIVDEKIYKNNLRNDQLAELIKQTDAINEIIYADESSPLNIAELRHYGIPNIIKAEKGAGSIQFGIQLIQQHHFKVTKRSENLLFELSNYVWKKTKDEIELNVPSGTDHAIDALRYFFRMKMNNKSQFKTFKWRR